MTVRAPHKGPARRTPQRTCVGCRETTSKRGLVRVVRTPENTVMVDPTGRRNGRGAYVHAARSCWESALRRDVLARLLRATLSPDDRAALQRYAAALPDDGVATPAL